MKKVAIALLVCAAAAFAECEFPYYPEFAEVVSQFDEVTPLMAKKAVMAEPCLGIDPGDVVCEPLLMRDVTGMPLCYMVGTYRGDDLDVAKRWNALVTRLNAGEEIDAQELAEECSFFYSDETRSLFANRSLAAYTFFSPTSAGSDRSPPFALVGYADAYATAKEAFPGERLRFTKIIGAGWAYIQIFEFQNPEGGKSRVLYEANGLKPTLSPDLDEEANKVRGWLKRMTIRIIYNPEEAEENRSYWRKVAEKVPDELAGREFPEVLPWE